MASKGSPAGEPTALVMGVGMCVHLSPEGPPGNSPLGGGGNGEAAVSFLILQMFVGEPLSPASWWALGVRVEGPVPALRVPRPAGETDRQTDSLM